MLALFTVSFIIVEIYWHSADAKRDIHSLFIKNQESGGAAMKRLQAGINATIANECIRERICRSYLMKYLKKMIQLLPGDTYYDLVYSP